MVPAMRCTLLIVGFVLFSTSVHAQVEFLPGMKWDAPPVVTPGDKPGEPPADAIVLFDGDDLSAWEGGDQWRIEEGVAYVQGGQITTKQKFGDIQLHLEWSAPTEVKGSGQGRGNSGVFLMGNYEIQILDNYDNTTYADGQAGSVYKQTPPMANAMRKPGEWNTYDIFWTTPKFNSSAQLEEPAYVTVIHNGVLLVNHFALRGDTAWHRPPRYVDVGSTGPIRLQDHGNPVAFRNIWVRELQPATGTRREPMLRHHGKNEAHSLQEELDAKEVQWSDLKAD